MVVCWSHCVLWWQSQVSCRDLNPVIHCTRSESFNLCRFGETRPAVRMSHHPPAGTACYLVLGFVIMGCNALPQTNIYHLSTYFDYSSLDLVSRVANMNPFDCSMCVKSSNHKKTLVIHLKSHPTPPHQCSTYKAILTQIHHFLRDVYICSTCFNHKPA